jgi:mannose-6-phosphate isomerase-like protein (cupin superfamily)
MDLVLLSQIVADRRASGKLYKEFLRLPTLSVGLYELPAGATDPQQPHAEDEVYYVVTGRGRFRSGAEDVAVEAGSVLLVRAGEVHAFHSIAEDLSLLVFFAPAEGTAGRG